jgi:DMSO/TMAO reductase YedYZ molybdopterin-dependent catalytic subunit
MPWNVWVVSLALLTAPPPVQDVAPFVTVVGPGGEQRIAHDALATLERTTITFTDHGEKIRFEGVELRHLLSQVGAPLGEPLRGTEVARYVLVEARDGYAAVFALAELDSGFTDRRVILADRRDGKPLGETEGPVRIVVEGENRAARSVRQVTRIAVSDPVAGRRKDAYDPRQ